MNSLREFAGFVSIALLGLGGLFAVVGAVSNASKHDNEAAMACAAAFVAIVLVLREIAR